MDGLQIDATATPRSYRVRDQLVTGSPGAMPIVVGVGIAVIVLGASMLHWIFTSLIPWAHEDVSWLVWALVQFAYFMGTLVGSTVILGGTAMVLIPAGASLLPSHTTWRLDGSGLYGTSQIGPWNVGSADYVPFVSIHDITQSGGLVRLLVKHPGATVEERDLARDLSPQEAVRLTALLQEDLASARSQWQDQGLVLHEHPAAPGDAGHQPRAPAPSP